MSSKKVVMAEQRHNGIDEEGTPGSRSSPAVVTFDESTTGTDERRSSLTHSSIRGWGASASSDIQQYSALGQSAVPSVSSICTSKQAEWSCEQCTYLNTDPTSRLCACCGWDRLAWTVDKNTTNVAASQSIPPATIEEGRVSSPTEQEKWSCQRCTFDNLDSSGRTCACCGWDRLAGVASTNNNNNTNVKDSDSTPAALEPGIISSSSSSGSSTSSSSSNEDILTMVVPASKEVSTKTSSSNSILSGDSSSSTFQSSAALSGGSSSSTFQSSLVGSSSSTVRAFNRSNLGSIREVFEDEASDIESQSDADVPSLSMLTVAPQSRTVVTNSTDAASNSDEAVSETRAKDSKQYFKSCSNRVALIWLIMFFIVLGGALTLGLLLRGDNSSGDSSTTSTGSEFDPPSTPVPSTSFPNPTPSPTLMESATAAPSDPPTTISTNPSTTITTTPAIEITAPPFTSPPSAIETSTVAPTSSPTGASSPSTEPTNPPSTPTSPPSIGEGTGNSEPPDTVAPTVPTTPVPTTTESSTPRPTPQGSVELVALGEEIDGGHPNVGLSYGKSLSLSGNGRTLAIGAPFGNNANQTNSGTVQVYRYSQGEWTQLGQKLEGIADDDKFGWGISLSNDGGRLVIGGPTRDITNTNTGYVVVYEYNAVSDTWLPLGGEIFGESKNDRIGLFVAMAANQNVVAVGGAKHVSVYKFDKPSSSWKMQGPQFDGGSEDGGGRTLSISNDGSTLAIGGPGAFPGFARVYDYDETKNGWIPRSELDYDNTDFDYDEEYVLAPSVSLSGSGDMIAVRATLSEGDSSVRVFDYDKSTTNWTMLGIPIDGGDGSKSMTLSDDGNIIAINGETSLRVFRFNKMANLWEVIVNETFERLVSDTSSLSGNGQVVAVTRRAKSQRQVKVIKLQ